MEGNGIVGQIVTVALAIVGVASLSVFLSKNANTVGVIQATGQAFSGALGVAISPITGQTSTVGGQAVNYGSIYPSTSQQFIG